jgi:hypothetical protein
VFHALENAVTVVKREPLEKEHVKKIERKNTPGILEIVKSIESKKTAWSLTNLRQSYAIDEIFQTNFRGSILGLIIAFLSSLNSLPRTW